MYSTMNGSNVSNGSNGNGAIFRDPMKRPNTERELNSSQTGLSSYKYVTKTDTRSSNGYGTNGY